jgi:hypothetical protein
VSVAGTPAPTPHAVSHEAAEMTHHIHLRLLLVIVLALILAVLAYAFTASNTVPGSRSGSGSGTISGYTISSVDYQLAAASPSNVDSVTFTLDASASTVKAKLVSGSSTYTSCSVVGGTDVTCDFSPDIAVSAADELAVIATA